MPTTMYVGDEYKEQHKEVGTKNKQDKIIVLRLILFCHLEFFYMFIMSSLPA